MLSQKNRYHIIILYEQGVCMESIAEQKHINVNTVSYWINHYKKYGNVDNKTRNRSEKLTEEQKKILIDKAKTTPNVTLTMLKNILKKENICISCSTIYKTLYKCNAKYKKP